MAEPSVDMQHPSFPGNQLAGQQAVGAVPRLLYMDMELSGTTALPSTEAHPQLPAVKVLRLQKRLLLDSSSFWGLQAFLGLSVHHSSGHTASVITWPLPLSALLSYGHL